MEDRRSDISFAAFPGSWGLAAATILIVVEAFVIALLLRANARRRRRLSFERVLSSVATALGTVTADEFDTTVRSGLRRVVDVMGLDEGALFEFAGDRRGRRSWTTGAAETGAHEFPWTMGVVQRGQIVAFDRIDELPVDAVVDRRTWRARRVKSQIALPLRSHGVVVGALLCAGPTQDTWERDGLLQSLERVSEAFAQALSHRQGELEMLRLRQELAHIGRVSALGELTASLAHELNQPLTAILSNAQVAQRVLTAEPVDVQEMHEILDDIVADDRRAADVIGRVRLLLRKGSLEYVSLDLNEIVADVVRVVASDAALRNVPMRLDPAPGLPRVRGDRVQLQQVLLNLVVNGLDAMRERGTADPGLVIRTFRDGAALVGVAVRDVGPGIGEKDADQIFEPLYTTKADGIGMGLAIARTIVDAHGGRVRAENNPEGGATFQFTIPEETTAA
jgi:C4-dicarboxylate-specific signal transduction histidine kinase